MTILVLGILNFTSLFVAYTKPTAPSQTVSDEWCPSHHGHHVTTPDTFPRLSLSIIILLQELSIAYSLHQNLYGTIALVQYSEE